MGKISDFQESILNKMQNGYPLTNHYETETAPYRSKDGMSSGSIETNSIRLTIPYRTIAALLSQGLIREASRYVQSDCRQGSNTWQSYKIFYELTDKGENVLVYP